MVRSTEPRRASQRERRNGSRVGAKPPCTRNAQRPPDGVSDMLPLAGKQPSRLSTCTL